MSLQCGLVGLPNVGKSTLFNALTCSQAEASNYPFCTIDPNIGIVPVPDERLQKITKLIEPQKTVATTVQFVDIAGLVKGASEGAGLGNQFLSHIRQTDAILHVVRCFEDENIVHVHDQIQPIEDVNIINTELLLADMRTLENRVNKTEKKAKVANDKVALKQVEVMKKCLSLLNQGKALREETWSEKEYDWLKLWDLITLKPLIYVCNISEKSVSMPFENDPLLKQMQSHAKTEQASIIFLCSALENEIMQLEEKDRQGFLQEVGLQEPGLHQLIQEAYKTLGLITYFTAGKKEVRAWTIKKGTYAPSAAGIIHTDFEKGFICSETYHCSELFEYQSEQALKSAGKFRQEGKNYIIKDGDVCSFRFNV